MELDRNLSDKYDHYPDRAVAFHVMQKAAFKVADHLLKKGDSVAWIEEQSTFFVVVPFMGKYQCGISSDIERDKVDDRMISFVIDFDSHPTDSYEFAEVLERWLENPRYADNLYQAALETAQKHEEWWTNYAAEKAAREANSDPE